MYTDYISASPLAEELDELIGRRLLSDAHWDKPCTAGVLIYHGILCMDE